MVRPLDGEGESAPAGKNRAIRAPGQEPVRVMDFCCDARCIAGGFVAKTSK